MNEDQARLTAAIQRVDEANAEDPRKVPYQGKEMPQELLYARRMTECLDRLAPGASEQLRLAVRCQHIRRWEIPRETYPMDRAGYHGWRQRLYAFHAEQAGEILREVGYDDATIAQVQDLLMKRRLKTDPEMQMLEDVVCLVFLEHHFADFAKQHDEEKLTRIIQKTWRKMSSHGQEAALELSLSTSNRALIEKSLEGV